MASENMGKFAVSRMGHDAGTVYVVLGEENGKLLVTDGRLRPVGKPKTKNPKHLKICRGAVAGETADLMAGKSGGADEAIRREISLYRKKED